MPGLSGLDMFGPGSDSEKVESSSSLLSSSSAPCDSSPTSSNSSSQPTSTATSTSVTSTSTSAAASLPPQLHPISSLASPSERSCVVRLVHGGRRHVGLAKLHPSARELELLRKADGRAGFPVLLSVFTNPPCLVLSAGRTDGGRGLEGRAPFSPAAATAILLGLCRALDFLHCDQELVHGRLYPRHVVLTTDGAPLLVGLSAVVDKSEEVGPGPEPDDAVFHSPAIRTGPPVDILALGVLGAWLVTGLATASAADWTRVPWAVPSRLCRLLERCRGVAWSRVSAAQLLRLLGDWEPGGFSTELLPPFPRHLKTTTVRSESIAASQS